MSGLLRRLVDGATGRGQPPVRSASRSAFAGAPRLLPEAPGREGLPPGSLPQPLQAPAAFMRAPAAPARGGDEARAPGVPALSPADSPAERRSRRDSAQAALRPVEADELPGRSMSATHDARTTDRIAAADARPPRAPEPLLPPIAHVDAPVAGAIRGVVATPPVTAGPRNAGSNEVHVTIGRIEITAVHEAAPPRRAGKTARPLTSLDDYLRQRQGGR